MSPLATRSKKENRNWNENENGDGKGKHKQKKEDQEEEIQIVLDTATLATANVPLGFTVEVMLKSHENDHKSHLFVYFPRGNRRRLKKIGF